MSLVLQKSISAEAVGDISPYFKMGTADALVLIHCHIECEAFRKNGFSPDQTSFC